MENNEQNKIRVPILSMYGLFILLWTFICSESAYVMYNLVGYGVIISFLVAACVAIVTADAFHAKCLLRLYQKGGLI